MAIPAKQIFVNVNEPVSNIFVDLHDGGMIFGAWIDEDSRANGFNVGDVIQNPAYIIESILRDVLNVPTAKIDYASFDVAGNTTDGILKDWSFAGGIFSITNVKDVLDNLCKQCKSQLYINPEGKFSLVTYNSAAAVDYTDYDFDTTNNIRGLIAYQTPYENIVSEVKINYALDRGSGIYRKVAFIKAKKRFSGTYLNEAIDTSEYEWNVDDGTKFQLENAPTACTGALAGLGAGLLSNGAYKYKITLGTLTTETEAGAVSNTVTVVDFTTNGQINLTAIPTGNSLMTLRRIYRTEAGGSTYKLVDTINDNTTTIYTDNIADGALGVTIPTSNITGSGLQILTDREINSIASVTGNTISLLEAAGERVVLSGSIKTTHNDNTQIWFIDKSSDAGDGVTADSTRESNARQAIWRYNAQNTIEIDADWIIEQATAILLRDYYFDFYVTNHWIIEFDTFLRASDLKIGHIIEFDSTIMNSYLLLGGDSWASKKFRVLSISRSSSMDFHVKAIEI